jgi:hypothetical protein
MRSLLYYLVQIVLIGSFFYMAYLPTLKIDFFSWGNNHNDGLYLLVVPMILLPLVIVFSLLKYWIVRKMNDAVFLRWSFLVTIVAAALNTLIVSVSSSNFGLLTATVVSAIVIILLLIETFLAQKKSVMKNPASA